MTIRKRLTLLVVSQLIAGALVLLTAVLLLGQVMRKQDFLAGYVFPPLAEIEVALDDAAELRVLLAAKPAEPSARALPILRRLRYFLDRYRREWQVADNPAPLARQQLAEIQEEHEVWLVDEERSAVASLHTRLDRLERDVGGAQPGDAALAPLETLDRDLGDFERALLRLDRVNFHYIDASFRASTQLTSSARRLLIVVGLLSMIAATLLGLSVHRSIAPRVESLVQKIKRFRELGIYEPSPHVGDDELTVLARALDVSFAAIMQRDKEREQFLAVAAHELKTPLTAMKGFAHAALAHPDDRAIRDRAMTVIDRQATRLARLIQDLLWLARAQAGELPFRPAPLDLEALARRAVGDVELAAKGRRFEMSAHGEAHILGDAGLLEHSVWSLLAQAATLACGAAPVRLVLDAGPTCVRLSVETESTEPLPYDFDEMMAPFPILHHEDRGSELRSTGLGLPLVRQIAKLHGATFQVERRADRVIAFKLELAR